MSHAGTRTFRPSRAPYSPSRAERQSRVTRLAVEALGTPDAMLFLNASDETLGGSPIDVAGDSDQSLSRAEAALTASPDDPARHVVAGALMKDHERYAATAAQHQQDADAARLDNVRERCQRSANAWSKMAEQARRTERRKEARERGDG